MCNANGGWRWAVGVLLMCEFTAAPGGESQVIQNVLSRPGMTLTGKWHVIVDPYENGLGGRYFEDCNEAAVVTRMARRAGLGKRGRPALDVLVRLRDRVWRARLEATPHVGRTSDPESADSANHRPRLSASPAGRTCPTCSAGSNPPPGMYSRC